jgi:UDP-3-O-[3-hydroxymyristoyl] N-acetylglucosamine deacetylase
MGFVRQRTIKTAVGCSGVGLHSGSDVSMTCHPADPETGIRFRRTGLAGGPVDIAATWRNVVERPLSTVLANGDGIAVATVEHLMSAFLGCGIDNVLIELDAEEVPAMDGSAAPFVAMIESAGHIEQAPPRWVLEILKPVAVVEPHRSVVLLPSDGFEIDFEIEFDNPVVAHQRWSVSVDHETYKREVAEARTFGFLNEVDQLRAKGLALGGSLDNAIVIDQDRIVNDGGLRFDNEFVRHKVLDAMGDLYLLGGPVLGHFRGIRAGHALTLRLLQVLFSKDDAWCWRKLREDEFDASTRHQHGVDYPGKAVAAAY